MSVLVGIVSGLLIWWSGIAVTMYLLTRFEAFFLTSDRPLRFAASLCWPVSWLIMLGIVLFIRPVMAIERMGEEQREFARGRSKKESER